MTRTIIAPESEEHWLQLRTQDVTSTDVAALFGLSPYKTPFEVFHAKKSGVVERLEPTERMRWGNRLEESIARGAAEDLNWSVAPMKAYVRDESIRIGSSFDFQARRDDAAEPGLMEVKNVSERAFRDRWKENGAGELEAPEHIELQLQHQLEVADLPWGAIVALVGGCEIRVLLRTRDREIGGIIRAKVGEFWQRIAANEPPPADYRRDADVLAALYAQANKGEVYDGTHDEVLAALVSQYAAAQQTLANWETKKIELRGRILEHVGAAEKAVGPWGSLALGATKGTAGRLITPEMVGTTIGGSKGYRQFRLTPKKES